LGMTARVDARIDVEPLRADITGALIAHFRRGGNRRDRRTPAAGWLGWR
jgi:hypothetical protein